MSIALNYQIEIYANSAGEAPFVEWLESLKDKTVRHRIKERLDRVALGNLGDYKALQEGVLELRLSFGSGSNLYKAMSKKGNPYLKSTNEILSAIGLHLAVVPGKNHLHSVPRSLRGL